MKVLVAGASGAIGKPLVAELIRQGHTVTGISRSIDRLAHLAKLGAQILAVDVFDAAAVERALRESEAEAVIDELTSLPRTPAEIHDALSGDRKVRLEGGGNLHRAAQAVGVRRYLQQSTGFFLAPASGLGTESDGLAVDAGGDIASSATMYTEIERRLAHIEEPLHLSIMGCEVNGQGEAHDSQLGVTFGKGVGMIFKDGRPLRKVSGADIVEAFVAETERLVAEGPKAHAEELPELVQIR